MDREVSDILIIGAGVAGMTAAIYGRRAGKSVTILEGNAIGGQVTETLTIENYPAMPHASGVDIAEQLEGQVREFEAKFKYGKVVKIQAVSAELKPIDVTDFVLGESMYEAYTDEQETFYGKTVIIATGTDYRKIGLPGEEELTGRGVSYCASCDGGIYKGKEVAVFGGGNSALYSVLYLSGVASKVYLIHHREEFRADKALVDKVRAKENVEMVLNSAVAGLLATGKDGGRKMVAENNGEILIGDEKLETDSVKIGDKVSGLVVIMGEGELPKGATVDSEGVSTRILDVSALFVEIGREPRNEVFSELVQLDPKGYVVAGEDCRVRLVGASETDGNISSEEFAPGIFAAGDCRTKDLRQVVTATSDGAIAANGAIKALQ